MTGPQRQLGGTERQLGASDRQLGGLQGQLNVPQRQLGGTTKNLLLNNDSPFHRTVKNNGYVRLWKARLNSYSKMNSCTRIHTRARADNH